MKLEVIGRNQTQVTAGNIKVLFSYNTPVAYIEINSNQSYKTNKKWSKTTTKHILNWLTINKLEAKELSQNVLEYRVNVFMPI